MDALLGKGKACKRREKGQAEPVGGFQLDPAPRRVIGRAQVTDPGKSARDRSASRRGTAELFCDERAYEQLRKSRVQQLLFHKAAQPFLFFRRPDKFFLDPAVDRQFLAGLAERPVDRELHGDQVHERKDRNDKREEDGDQDRRFQAQTAAKGAGKNASCRGAREPSKGV